MKTIPWILSAALTLSFFGCAYDPLLPEDPFWCGPGGKCPEGYSCYGGICSTERPACMDPSNPEYADWPDDSDLEPNNHPDLAVTLPCMVDPTENPDANCPARTEYTNGFMNLLICPSKDRDMYKFYMLQDEVIAFSVLYNYGDGTLPRDIDARVWRYDFNTEQYIEAPINPGGQSTRDNENFTLSTELATGNPAGWYYLEVYGKTGQDVNTYTVTFTLNPPPEDPPST
jgi:hypothetical protein